MSMHRANKCKRGSAGSQSDTMPWFIKSVARRKKRNQMAKNSKRKNR